MCKLTSLKDVKKKNDAFSRRSAVSLKEDIKRRITFVYVTLLECLEIKFGKNFEGYNEMRAKFLRVGNDAIRNIDEKIDKFYNIEKVLPTTIIMRETTDLEQNEEGV